MKAYLAIAVPERAPRARILAALCAMLPRVGVADDGSFVCDLRGTERLLGTPLPRKVAVISTFPAPR